MIAYPWRQVEEAQQYAATGGQALHLHAVIVNRAKAPACFLRAVDRGEWIAHLFDQDEARLRAMVRRLGVNVVVVEHPGTPRQHVDLCGKPLGLALAACGNRSEIPSRPRRDQEAPPATPSLLDLLEPSS